MSGQQQIPYLEERKLIKRWSGPWPMLANMAFTLLIFAVTWWVFQDPRGIMRFYTPYVGYNYCRWWLIILIWMAYIFDFWPFRRDWVRSAHPLQKGLVLALVSVGIMIAMIHGFFEGVLGNLAFAYFNPAQLQKLGLTDFYSTEYAAQACMMFAVIASWISPAWLVALEGQPWAGLSQPVRGFSIWLGTFCLSLLIYFRNHAQPHGHPVLPVAVLHRHLPAVLGAFRGNRVRQLPRGVDHVLHRGGVVHGKASGSASRSP